MRAFVFGVAALGVAIYSLMKDDDTGSGSRSGLASDSRVSRLDDRVDRISRQVQSLRSSGGASSDGVEDRVAAVEKTVKTLAERPSTDPQQAIDELSNRIDDVAQDVEALKQQSQTTP
jgi:prefoldin subunit 5